MMCSTSFTKFYFYFTTICAILSILGALSVMAAIIRLDRLQTFSLKILFYISVTDLIRGIITIIQNFSSSSMCGLVAFVTNASFISSIAWALYLSSAIYFIVVKERLNFEKTHRYWFFASFCIVPLLQALPFITNSFVFYDGMCQISLDITGNIYRLLLIHAPALFMVFIMFWHFTKVFFKVRLLGDTSIKTVIFKRGFIYAIIIGAVNIPLGISRGIMALDINCNAVYSSLTFDGLVILNGFINCLVFFFSGPFDKTISNRISVDYCESLHTLKISFRSTLSL